MKMRYAHPAPGQTQEVVDLLVDCAATKNATDTQTDTDQKAKRSQPEKLV